MPKIIDNVKEEIIKTAQKVFFKEDFESLSMRRIAKECNIALGTVYNYFPSKQDLMKEILKVHISNVMNNLREAIKAEKTNKEKIRQIYLTLRNSFVKSDKQIVRNMASIVMSYPLEETQIIAMEIKNFGEKFNDLLKEELDISDEVTVYMIVNSLMFFSHTPEYDFEQIWKGIEKLMYPELQKC